MELGLTSFVGLSRFMLHTAGSVSPEKALRSIELIGKEVAPLLR